MFACGTPYGHYATLPTAAKHASLLTFRLAVLPLGELDVRVIAPDRLSPQFRLQRLPEQPGGNVGVVNVAKKANKKRQNN